ncbi:MAG: hypothetical protein WA801_20510, partial [Pseudolabrys sp.]
PYSWVIRVAPTGSKASPNVRYARQKSAKVHVQTLLVREPGGLAIDRSAAAAGPHREGEEP